MNKHREVMAVDATFEPTPRTMTAQEARESWDDLVQSVRDERTRVVVEQDGKPAVAVVPLADLARLTGIGEDRIEVWLAFAPLAQALKEVPEDEVEHEVARAVAEARRQMREVAAGRDG